jgi:ssDNA-binding Zn-finger/Zn-ribbon topoisomerase 1
MMRTGLPLTSIPCRSSYAVAALREMIASKLATELALDAPHEDVLLQPEVPACPTCGIPMIPRVSKRGQAAGRSFYGCSNYPQCRQVVER